MIGNCWRHLEYLDTVSKQMVIVLPASTAEKGWFSFLLTGIDYFGSFLVKQDR